MVLFKKIKYRWSILLCLTASMAASGIFHPGIFSSDSLNMVYEAYLVNFNDMHAPLLPAMLLLDLKAGGTVGLFMFIQCLAGLFGLRQLVLASLGFFGTTEGWVDRLTCLITALLISPLTPLLIYLLTFWTDTWLIIFLLWSLALLIDLYRSHMDSRRDKIILSMAVLLIGLALLVRQNSLVIYPFAALALEIPLRRRFVPTIRRFLILLVPLAVYLSFTLYQYQVLKANHTHPERAVYALDLASMILRQPQICNDPRLTSCDLVMETFPPDFVVGHGAIDLTFNQGQMPHDFFLNLVEQPALKDEWLRAAWDRPLLFATVKLLNFLDYLRPDFGRYFYQERTLYTSLGLSFDGRFAPERNAWFSMTDWVRGNPILHWFSFVHAPWLILDLIGATTCLVLAARRKQVDGLFLGVICLIPLSYYFSYLLALTTSEFRFMFPSTLVVQIFLLTFLFGRLAARLDREPSIQAV